MSDDIPRTLATIHDGTWSQAFRPGRQLLFSPSKWEPQIGYARAVKAGNLIFVAGTVAADENGSIQGDDAYSQTDFIITKIRTSLRNLGADLEHVTNTVTYLSTFADFDEYARAHKKYFANITPVNTTVQVALVRPEFRVEISAMAVIQ
jgi:enamine deaminase RidA (YjgF/YER057c/UK114 family)